MDVVVAPATAPGRGAIAVVRISGDGLDAVLARIARPLGDRPLLPGRVRRVTLHDEGGAFDDGLLWLARGPRTYTGEDLAEIGLHGNPLLVERLVAAAQRAGARLASPGELTRRALLNGKLDLLAAEAVLQTVDAETPAGLDVARQGADGRLRDFVDGVASALRGVAAELEARLDHPGDELALESDAALLHALTDVADRADALAGTFAAGRTLVHGARVALVGAVNAGKSSLFNALVGRPRALVHESPGTTRDVLEVRVRLDEVAVTLLDTAGERETADPVEAAGLALARELTDEADLLVVVLRARGGGPDGVERAILERTVDRPRVLVYNGVDRPGTAPGPADAVRTVATTGEGVPELGRRIARSLLGASPADARLVVASARQRDLLAAVAGGSREAAHALPLAGPAVAADAVVRALEHIDALTGADTRERVLDELFARFCIGK